LGREESKWWEGRTSRVGGIFISERETHTKNIQQKVRKKEKRKDPIKR
jgi:hypothetical protein